MFRIRFACLVLAIFCLLPLGAAAAQVDSDATYCFSAEDFATEENLAGICITHLRCCWAAV